jgi:hypothetical protein
MHSLILIGRTASMTLPFLLSVSAILTAQSSPSILRASARASSTVK